MAAQERSESTDAVLDGLLQQLTSDFEKFTSHIADRQCTERSAFEQQMSTLRNEKETRQGQRKAIQEKIKSLQEELQDLDRQDDMDNNKAIQLQSEYNAVKRRWEQTQQEWKARLSAAVPPMERIPPSSSPEVHGANGPQDSPATPSRAQGEIESHSQVRQDLRIGTSRAAESLSLAPSKPGVLRHPEPVLAATNQQSSDGVPNVRRTQRKRDSNERDGGDRRPANHPRKKARNDERAIDFNDVYQNGNAEHKHAIIEYPSGSDRWYILRCDLHCHFGSNPLQGAMEYLNGKRHGNLPKNSATAIEKLGIRVRDCDARKARRNNLAFNLALDAGYQPFRVKPAHLSRPETGEQPGSAPNKVSHDHRPTIKKQGRFEGITNPAVGELYRVLYESAYHAVLMLPTGSFESVGMVGSIAETGLAGYIPRCYRSDRQSKTIHGWADDYKDDGPLIHRRKFPVMYLDGLDVPLDGEFGIPEGNLFSWVPARDLRRFSLDDPECRSVCGFGAARSFRWRMEKMADAQRHGSHGLLLVRTEKSMPS
ncbi:uncharacterized protein B0T15DRAFT_187976 [Chaetomium strumarium]|uniref:Uncharacterized protein n=1 Tax=Chaetomium strumarium TaxID=1170767 RepID=A0AAJ0M116_9PEZI|nr:hypothetical protein B0T15DRAFT_187976 [Chaetomium strumarium]